MQDEFLERVHIKPNICTSENEKNSEMRSEFVIARGEAAKLFESSKQVFDQMARTITLPVEGVRSVMIRSRRDHGLCGGRVLMGILAYAAYANLLYHSRSRINDGALPPTLGLWWVHSAVLTVTVAWLRRQSRGMRS